MLIDFEEKFSKYLDAYFKEHDMGEEEVEDIIPELYLEWLDIPQDWLSGKSPNEYFGKLDAGSLIETFGKYIFAGMQPPGALLNNIADTKDETYPFLISLMKSYDGEKSGELKSAVVRLIEETDMPHPYDYYIDVIAASAEINDFAEACVQELKNSGIEYRERIMTAFESAESRYSSDCFLDVLSDFPYDERVYNHALEKFLYSSDFKAFYANCLGKLGNEAALQHLEEALKDDTLSYFDYVSVKNAYEELGGEINIERDFSGDQDYEMLKHMEE